MNLLFSQTVKNCDNDYHLLLLVPICRYTSRLCKLVLMKYGLFIRLFSMFVFATKCLGGYCCGVPPLPIPNREVKPACADGTAMQCGRVGRRPLYFEVSL